MSTNNNKINKETQKFADEVMNFTENTVTDFVRGLAKRSAKFLEQMSDGLTPDDVRGGLGRKKKDADTTK